MHAESSCTLVAVIAVTMIAEYNIIICIGLVGRLTSFQEPQNPLEPPLVSWKIMHACTSVRYPASNLYIIPPDDDHHVTLRGVQR
jgi:hypothetical protein